MTLLALESFDTVAVDSATDVPELVGKGWNNLTGGGFIIEAVSPRFAGSQYLRSGTTGRGIYHGFTAAATMYMGAAVRFETTNATREFFGFRDSTTKQVEVATDASGHLICTRNGTAIGSAGATVLAVNTWYYIEFKATIANSPSGSFEIKLDGVSEITGSGLDTQNSANATVDRAVYSGDSSDGNIFWDDLYVDTAQFNGPIRIAALVPNGNGNSSDLTGSDGNSTDNYLLVDDQMTEGFANGDTDYVEKATVSDHDTYAFSNMPSTPSSIVAIQSSLAAKADDAGAKGIRIVTRSGGTDYESATFNLSGSYVYYREIRVVDPATTAAWTQTNVNAVEMGMKVQS